LGGLSAAQEIRTFPLKKIAVPDREQTKSEINENFEFIIPREKNLRNKLKPKREIA
jgi:hypothetical protein